MGTAILDVDLSTGNYDELETRLSESLGLKVLLVRWQAPQTGSYGLVDGVESFETDDPVLQDLARREMAWHRKWFSYINGDNEHPGEEPRFAEGRKSLRAYLQSRDKQLGDTIDDEELNSYLHRRHITLRKNNASPPHTVIVPDCDFSNEDAMKEWAFDLPRTMPDVYSKSTDDYLNPSDFIENIDIDPQEARSYEVLRRIRYALQNQNEYDNQNRSSRSNPRFYHYAGLETEMLRMPTIENLDCDRGFTPLQRLYRNETFWDGPLQTEPGAKSSDIIQKLTLARAIREIHYMMINPQPTIARLAAQYWDRIEGPFAEFDPDRFNKFQQSLAEDLREFCKKSLPARSVTEEFNFHYSPHDDLRLSIPIFREAYKSYKDKIEKSGDAENESYKMLYLDTIWEGIETYMPTLAAAPVPTLTVGGSLPKSAKEYRPAEPAPALS